MTELYICFSGTAHAVMDRSKGVLRSSEQQLTEAMSEVSVKR